jgi:hypothetical protein
MMKEFGVLLKQLTWLIQFPCTGLKLLPHGWERMKDEGEKKKVWETTQPNATNTVHEEHVGTHSCSAMHTVLDIFQNSGIFMNFCTR